MSSGTTVEQITVLINFIDCVLTDLGPSPLPSYNYFGDSTTLAIQTNEFAATPPECPVSYACTMECFDTGCGAGNYMSTCYFSGQGALYQFDEGTRTYSHMSPIPANGILRFTITASSGSTVETVTFDINLKQSRSTSS